VLIVGTHEVEAGSFRTVQGREVQDNRRLFDFLSEFHSHSSPSHKLSQLDHKRSFSLRHAQKATRVAVKAQDTRYHWVLGSVHCPAPPGRDACAQSWCLVREVAIT
jgi:hypothetical protein